MKHIVIAMVVAASIAVVGCHKHKSNPVDRYDFDKVLSADKELVESANPDFTIKFYEAQGILASPLNETFGTPKVVGMKTVWAKISKSEGSVPKPIVVLHEEGAFDSQPVVQELQGLWVEDQIVDVDHKISAEKAAELVLQTNIKRIPDSRTFSFRQPVWKTMPTEKYYIFGSFGRDGLVQVNSETGEVKDCEF